MTVSQSPHTPTLYQREGAYIPRVAAVHDLCGYGKCSLGVAIPVLSAAGADVCPVPTGLTISGILAYSADVYWVPGATETQWELEYGLENFTIGSGTNVTVNGTAYYQLQNLAADTTMREGIAKASAPVDPKK